MNDITSSWWGHLRVQYCIWWTDVKMWVSINRKVFEVKTVFPLISDVHICHRDTSLCCLLKVIRADSTVSKQSRRHVTVAVIFSALHSRKDTRVLPSTDWKLWFKCLWGLVSSDSFGLTSRSPCEASLKLRESPLQTLAPPSPLHWLGRRLMTLCLSSNRLSDNRPGSPSLLPCFHAQKTRCSNRKWGMWRGARGFVGENGLRSTNIYSWWRESPGLLAQATSFTFSYRLFAPVWELCLSPSRWTCPAHSSFLSRSHVASTENSSELLTGAAPCFHDGLVT